MQLHADLRRRAVVRGQEVEWVPSPQAGVERRMLERDGDEVARATSIVRYAPGSSFPEHVHGGGEELLVLDGTFSDEGGVYRSGTYVRNPPGSRHAPSSREGCTLLVKLRQMSDDETERVLADTVDADWIAGPAPGVQRLPLFSGPGEEVELVRLGGGAELVMENGPGGVELFVVEGELLVGEEPYPRWSWMREPKGLSSSLQTAEGCTLYVKRGHLPVPPG